MAEGTDHAGEGMPDGLKRTLVAIGSGWVVPGLGHLLLGRGRRALLFAALILVSYGIGLAHDGRLALHDDRQPFLTSLQIVANVGIGPIDLFARLFVYGEAAYAMPRGPEDDATRIFRDRTRSPLSIYGTAYLWTAGLMNLLLLFDVWDIGMGRKP